MEESHFNLDCCDNAKCCYKGLDVILLKSAGVYRLIAGTCEKHPVTQSRVLVTWGTATLKILVEAVMRGSRFVRCSKAATKYGDKCISP
jgi:hypothetical protein